MATNSKHLYLGAPDLMVVDYNLSTQVDLGSSEGGATFTYKPKYFAAEIDQVPGPVAAWRSGEEATLEVTLSEQQINRFLTVMSYTASSDTATTAGALGAIGSGGALVVNGTGASTNYSYQIFAFTSQGDGIPGTAVTTSAGPVTLTSVNSITVPLPALPSGAIGFGVIRTVGGAAQGLLMRLAGNATSLTDTGLVATAYTNAAVQPATNAQDTAAFGGNVAVPIHQFDLGIPTNTGSTSAHLRYRFPKVYFSGQPGIDYKKDKNSTYKVELSVLTDPSATAAGQMFTSWIET